MEVCFLIHEIYNQKAKLREGLSQAEHFHAAKMLQVAHNYLQTKPSSNMANMKVDYK